MSTRFSAALLNSAGAVFRASGQHSRARVLQGGCRHLPGDVALISRSQETDRFAHGSMIVAEGIEQASGLEALQLPGSTLLRLLPGLANPLAFEGAL